MTIKSTTALVGTTFSLTSASISPYPEDLVDGAKVDVTIMGTDGTGTVSGGNIMVIMESAIAAPCGTCVDIEVDSSCVDAHADDTDTAACETTAVEELTEGMRFAVLDDDGCPTQSFTLKQLTTYITGTALKDVKFCDLVKQAPESPTPGLLLLGVSAGPDCELTTIPADSVKCTTAEPEPWDCGKNE